MPTVKRKWYRRTLYGRTSTELATKLMAWESYAKTTGNIELQVLPLNYNLETDNFNRVIRVYPYIDESELKVIANEIEVKVTSYMDGYGKQKS